MQADFANRPPQPIFDARHSFRLAIVGASARGAAHAALRAGCLPVAADLFADADLQQVCPATRIANYPDGLARWLNQTECDGWCYTGALENYPRLVGAMAAGGSTLLGNRAAVLESVRSPLRLAEVLAQAGLRFPETHAFSPTHDSAQSPEVRAPELFTGKDELGQFLWKTYQGSSGSGVRPVHDGPPVVQGPLYLQRSICGVGSSAVFVGNGRQAVLLGITRQLVGEPWTGAAPLQYCGSIGPLHPLAETVRKTIARIGNVLAENFGLVGLFGVDLILDGDRVWTIEVNPRYTAAVEIVERVADIPAIAHHLGACLHGKLPSTSTMTGRQESGGNQLRAWHGPHVWHGKAILFATQAATVTRAFARWALQLTQQNKWPKIADIPVSGRRIEPRQPVLTVFATGSSSTQVESNLRRRVAEAERRLYRVETT